MKIGTVFSIAVFVVYSASFFVMAAVLWLNSERTAKLGVAGKLRLLALFAAVHGSSDMIDAILRLPTVNADPTGPWAAVRLTLLVASFVILLQFGLGLLVEDEGVYRSIIGLGFLAMVGLISGLVALYAHGVTAQSVYLVERTARLVIGLPGALLSGVAFVRFSGRCSTLGMKGCADDSRFAGVALVVYGIVAGAVATGYPTAVTFLGLPIQFYRMVAAIALTVACVSLLRRFAVKR